MTKAEQAIQGYKWLSENAADLLRYFEALEQGECRELNNHTERGA